mmetsp:Transcript_12531/g.26469  ORF Transcript_12531/g.26469 Transcript_12531/m.26469 type:complete len:360 (-) Transcript_12531:892-1971(-)
MTILYFHSIRRRFFLPSRLINHPHRSFEQAAIASSSPIMFKRNEIRRFYSGTFQDRHEDYRHGRDCARVMEILLATQKATEELERAYPKDRASGTGPGDVANDPIRSMEVTGKNGVMTGGGNTIITSGVPSTLTSSTSNDSTTKNITFTTTICTSNAPKKHIITDDRIAAKMKHASSVYGSKHPRPRDTKKTSKQPSSSSSRSSPTSSSSSSSSSLSPSSKALSKKDHRTKSKLKPKPNSTCIPSNKYASTKESTTRWEKPERQRLNQLYFEIGRPHRPPPRSSSTSHYHSRMGVTEDRSAEKLLKTYARRHRIVYEYRTEEEVMEKVRYMWKFNLFKEEGEEEYWRNLGGSADGGGDG